MIKHRHTQTHPSASLNDPNTEKGDCGEGVDDGKGLGNMERG